jgi:hypothetical protein
MGRPSKKQEQYKLYAVANLHGKAALAQEVLSDDVEASQHEAAPVSQPPIYAQVLVGQQIARGTPAALQDRKQPREKHPTGYSPEKKLARRAISEDQRKIEGLVLCMCETTYEPVPCCARKLDWDCTDFAQTHLNLDDTMSWKLAQFFHEDSRSMCSLQICHVPSTTPC